MRADRDLPEGQVLALIHGDAIRGVVERGVIDQLGLARVRARVGVRVRVWVRVRVGARVRFGVQSSELG